MDLRHQRYFIAVAEELHFGRAAARLGISQPALSKQIRDLEQELGVPLLWRKDGVRPTAAGAAFLGRAREILSQVDRATREVQSIGRGDLGSLEIGFMSATSARQVPTVVRAFRKRHPRVEVRLRLLLPTLPLDQIRKGLLDFAFVVNTLPSQDVVLEPTLEEPYVLALPVGHPLARRASVPLRALHQVPFVFYPRHVNSELFDEVIGFMKGAGAVPDIVLEAFPVQAMLSAVAAGIGVTLIPDGMRDIRQKGVVYRRIPPPVPTIGWALAFRKGPMDAAQEAFLDVVRSVYGKPARQAGTSGRPT